MQAGLAAIGFAILVTLAAGPASALPAVVRDAVLPQSFLWRIAVSSPALEEAKRARAIADAGQLQEAIEVAEHALDLAKREFPKDHAYIAFILDDLATFHLRLNRLDEALNYSRPAMATIERAAPGSVAYAALAGHLATIYGARGEYAKAEPLYKQAYGIFLARRGRDDTETASTARNLAIAYAELSRAEEALAYFEDATAARKRLDGATSSAYAQALLDLAGAQLALERPEIARVTAGKAREILEQQGAGIVALTEADTALARVYTPRFRSRSCGVAPAGRPPQTRRRGSDEGRTAAPSASYDIGFVHFLARTVRGSGIVLPQRARTVRAAWSARATRRSREPCTALV